MSKSHDDDDDNDVKQSWPILYVCTLGAGGGTGNIGLVFRRW